MARSFSGDQKQLRPLLKAAFGHHGTAVIDVISPCVTFADHEGSTKSYAAVKEHDAPLHDIEYVPYFEDITVDYEPGTTREVDDARRLAHRAQEARGGLRSHRLARARGR